METKFKVSQKVFLTDGPFPLGAIYKHHTLGPYSEQWYMVRRLIAGEVSDEIYSYPEKAIIPFPKNATVDQLQALIHLYRSHLPEHCNRYES